MEKNNNGKKLLKYVGIGIATIFTGWMAYRAYKKELEKVLEADENDTPVDEIKTLDENPDVEKRGDAGTSEIREVETESNFVKDLYIAACSENSDIDKSFTDVDEILKEKKGKKDKKEEKKILHVMERFDKERGCAYLKLMIEIPEYSNSVGNFNKLRISDIITECRYSGNYVMAKILELGQREAVRPGMVAVMKYSYAVEGSDIRKVQFLEVPNWILRKIYEEENENQDGKKFNMAVRFFEDSRQPEKRAKIWEKAGQELSQLLDEDVVSKAGEEGDTIVPGSFCNKPVELMYSVGFPETVFLKENETFTMTTAKAVEIIDYYINDFKIEKTGKKRIPGSPVPVDEVLDSFLIDGVMFHAPNSRGKFDSLARFYYTEKSGRVDIDSLKESEDDEEEAEPEREVTRADLRALKNHFSTKK